jgi:proline iminopeptidase
VNPDGELVRIDDTALFVVERGRGHPVIVLHGGPGLDHHEFADYLDPLTDEFRLPLVDQRANGRSKRPSESTWTLERMAQDVIMMARAMRLERYSVLGHSYGAFVALQNAVDYPGMATRTIVSGGIASAKYLDAVEPNLEHFEPAELREQVATSWAREADVRTQEDVASLMHDQWPFHFVDPFDPRIEEYERRTAWSVFAPDALRWFATQTYGGIELEDRLGSVTQPVLVLAGRHDRTCPVAASRRMVELLPNAELHVFEQSAHMTFVEEPEAFLEAVRRFLSR